jgi:hypothetical protein
MLKTLQKKMFVKLFSAATPFDLKKRKIFCHYNCFLNYFSNLGDVAGSDPVFSEVGSRSGSANTDNTGIGHLFFFYSYFQNHIYFRLRKKNLKYNV